MEGAYTYEQFSHAAYRELTALSFRALRLSICIYNRDDSQREEEKTSRNLSGCKPIEGQEKRDSRYASCTR